MSLMKFLFGSACVTCTACACYYLYDKYKDKSKTKKVKSKVLFSSEESVKCKPHFKEGKPCNRLHCPVRTIK